MQELPDEIVLKNHPKQYLKQGLNHCGAFAVKAILSAYGKDNRTRPQDYHITRFGKLTGSASPYIWVQVLRSYGLRAELKNARELPNSERLQLLKKLLASGNPVMIRIGNGYTRRGGWGKLRWLIIGHWVTLWGYDNNKQIFYVYGPRVPQELDDPDIPIGNKKRTYGEILRDWQRGGLFPPMPAPYLYIEVNSQKI